MVPDPCGIPGERMIRAGAATAVRIQGSRIHTRANDGAIRGVCGGTPARFISWQQAASGISRVRVKLIDVLVKS